MKKYEIANVRQRTNHTFLWMIYYTLIVTVFSGIIVNFDKNINSGLLMAVLVMVGCAFVYLCNFKRWPFELKNTDENRKQMTVPKFLIIICLLFTCQLVSFILMKLYTLSGLPEANISAESLQGDTSVFMVLYASLIGPIVEELMFRGFIIGSTKQNGKIIAIVLSAFIFGLMHANPLQFFAGFVSGLLLGYVFVEYSIVWTIILHIFNNFVLNELPLLLFKDASIDGTVDYIIIGFAVLLTVIAVIYLVKKKTISTFLKNPENHGEKGAVKKTLASAWLWVYIAFNIFNMVMVIFYSANKPI